MAFSLDISHTKKGNGVIVTNLNPSRFKAYGFGTFMEKIKKDEIRITAKAKDILLSCPERSGLQGLEFWPNKTLAWGALSRKLEIDNGSINVPDEAKKWIKSLVVVK